MTINPRDFIGPCAEFPFVGRINYSEVIKFSDKDFAEFYYGLMKEYQDKDDWWADKENIPPCNRCYNEISGPKDLRRLAGRTLHPNCFSEEMNLRKIKNPLEKKYWERVLKVNLSLLNQ